MCVRVDVGGGTVTRIRDAHSCRCVAGLQGHACAKCHVESLSNPITPAFSVAGVHTETGFTMTLELT